VNPAPVHPAARPVPTSRRQKTNPTRATRRRSACVVAPPAKTHHNLPIPATPTRAGAKRTQSMQPDATRCNQVQPPPKNAKRTQVPIWHTPAPPSPECAKFPNEPTARVTPPLPPNPAPVQCSPDTPLQKVSFCYNFTDARAIQPLLSVPSTVNPPAGAERTHRVPPLFSVSPCLRVSVAHSPVRREP
jgi:hypothetical protein